MSRNGLPDKQSTPQNMHTTPSRRDAPIVSCVAGPKFASLDTRTLTNKILERIEEAMLNHPDMILRCRTKDSFRIDYDPDAEDVTSIESRMNSIMSPIPDYIALNNLLAPLISTIEGPSRSVLLTSTPSASTAWSRRLIVRNGVGSRISRG